MPAQLLIASSSDANMRYATGLSIPDPFVWISLGKHAFVIVSKLEYSRAKKETKPGTKVVLLESLKLDNVRKPAGRKRNLADIAASVLLEYNATDVAVPKDMWTLHYQTLQEHGFRPKVQDPYFPARLVKTSEEVQHIKNVGIVAKKAFKHALGIVKTATIEWNDTLTYKGQRVTSEYMKDEIERIFLAHGCQSGETIVACGEQAAEPHNRGSGPLYAGQPIIIDIFPRSIETGFFFDLTRTIIKGTPSKDVRHIYATVRKAQQAALDAVRPGPASRVHEACSRVFHQEGYVTSDEEGFIHSTGHGLGLEIHEQPRLSEKSEDELVPGMVVTVEPGLYYKELGGVRIEDTVLVTKDGCRNLTNLPKMLIVP